MLFIKKGFNCCSDQIIAVHYMNPREILRLDIAIEVQNNILNLYKKHIDLGLKVTFRDILRNYNSLADFEIGTEQSNYLKDLLNSDN